MDAPAIDVSALTDVATLSTPRLRLEPLGIVHLDHVWDSLFDEETLRLAAGRPGRGYGTEATRAVLDYAFDRIGVHRVELDVYSFNPRAQRSYEKAGFRYEGRQRHTLFWDGEWADSILMAVLSTDERPAAP